MGDYLLINVGDRFTSLVLAKYDGGKWMLCRVAIMPGFCESNAGIYYASLGVNTDDSCWLALYKIASIITLAVVTKVNKLISPTEGMIVRWLDW